jgi:cbb3-type cytochrome oxidase maturation protein
MLIVVSLALGVVAWLGFVWSVRSGQYDDPEGPKYRMLHDDEAPEPPQEVGPRSGLHEKRIDAPERKD